MNVVSRGIRNAFRNFVRTFSVVVILGISVGLSLSMLVARRAVDEKITSVKSSIGNTISVSPAGSRGFEGGGEALTTQQMKEVSAVEHVTNVSQTLSDRLTADNTNLESSIEPGSLGNRAQGNSGIGFRALARGGVPTMGGASDDTNAIPSNVIRTFRPPVTITGTNDATTASVYGGDSITFTSGEAFDATKDENKAVLGKAIAEKNKLSVGSTFMAYGETIAVTGIYDTGNTFANNGVIVSLSALQRLSKQSGAVTSATATVDSVDNINAAVSAIETKLGDAADVVSNQESAKNAVEPLESVKNISTYSVFAAVGTGAIIILLTMMMIVRERRREIGVMKAIGSTNGKTMLQFMSEAITLTLLGLIIGLIISVFVAQPITKVLVNNSSSSTSLRQVGLGQAFLGGGARMRGVPGALRGVQDVKSSVGADVLVYGLGVAFLIAIIGSALPAYLISKVSPAEVMRAE